MAETLALALAIAASPFAIVPSILLLFTARPRPTSLAFLGAWFAAVTVVAAVAAVLADVVNRDDSSPTWLSWLRVAVGIALIGYGLRQWVTRHNGAEKVPTWLTAVQQATPRSAVRLAVLLSVANPKVVLLTVAGGLEIGAAGTGPGRVAGAVVVFAAVASVSVAAPPLAEAVGGARVLDPLKRAEGWLLRNNTAVMAVIFAIIGVVLVTNGLAGL